MKKTKKLAALFLAMVMAFSLMAVTAAAYGAEEHVHDETCCAETIQPRKPGAPECLYCGYPMTDVGTGSDGGGSFNWYQCKTAGCPNRNSTPVRGAYWD